MKLTTAIILIPALLVTQATAKSKVKSSNTKSHASNISLVEAFTQRTLPGIPQAKPVTETHLVIVWHNATPPESFYWRGESGFLACNIEQAHKLTAAELKKMPRGFDYSTAPIAANKIHKGDTLQLTPVGDGNKLAPKEVPATAKNTLFYNTKGAKMLSFKIATLSKKADIAMP